MSKGRKNHKEGGFLAFIIRACCWMARDLKYCATVEIWFATPVTNPSGSPDGPRRRAGFQVKFPIYCMCNVPNGTESVDDDEEDR